MAQLVARIRELELALAEERVVSTTYRDQADAATHGRTELVEAVRDLYEDTLEIGRAHV